MIVKTYGCALQGIEGLKITIEVDVSNGLQYHTVGLADTAVRESMFRVGAAIKASKLNMPKKRILVHLAPADIKKEGSAYDLPIAIGILAASKQIPHQALENYFMMGELSLSGELKPIKGALSMALQAQKQGLKAIILPHPNAEEANLIPDFPAFGFHHLKQVIQFLKGDLPAPALHKPN